MVAVILRQVKKGSKGLSDYWTLRKNAAVALPLRKRTFHGHYSKSNGSGTVVPEQGLLQFNSTQQEVAVSIDAPAPVIRNSPILVSELIESTDLFLPAWKEFLGARPDIDRADVRALLAMATATLRGDL
jgi:hypothetical protein